jgi:hypothetical protein
LVKSKDHGARVELHAGFLPRPYSDMTMTSVPQALELAKVRHYIAYDEKCIGSQAHYNVFESIISGRNMHNDSLPSNSVRDIFPMLLIKGASLANKINNILAECNENDTFFAICGIEHMAYGYGIPERIYDSNKDLKNQTYLICSKQERSKIIDTDKKKELKYGPELTEMFTSEEAPADLCFYYNENESYHSEEQSFTNGPLGEK